MNDKKTISDRLAEILQTRAEILASEDEEFREIRAGDLLLSTMFLVHKLLGAEVLQAALGTVDEDDPVAVLKTAANRISVLSAVFYKLPQDAASPFAVAREAMAIAHGDKPHIFAQIKSSSKPVVKDREHRLKMQAFVWDAFLKAKGMSAIERSYKIGEAYSSDWGNIKTSWKRDIASIPREIFKFAIALGTEAGLTNGAHWELADVAGERAKNPEATKKMEDWEVALKMDARALQRARKASAKR
jgi:hypothetical protein